MQTIFCFDYGHKKIGLAVGNTCTFTANELTTLHCNNHTPDWSQLDKLIHQWQPDLLLIGLPLNLDGSVSQFSKQVRKFGKLLKTRYNLPVEYEDERLSSNEANSIINNSLGTRNKATKKQRLKRDQIAAKLILNSYLNRHE